VAVRAFWPVPLWATILLGMGGSESGHYADGDLPAPMSPRTPGLELTGGHNFLI